MRGTRFVLLAALSVLAPGEARAQQASAAPRARMPARASIEVLVIEDPTTDWGGRVRGQLSDLPARARVLKMSTLARQSPAPDATTAASRTALTAWLTTAPDSEASGPGGTFIAIWFAGANGPSTRRIADAWSTLSAADRSAALELAALSVRGAVRSLLVDRASEDAPGATGASRDAAPSTTSAPSTPEPADTAASAESVESAATPTSLEPALREPALREPALRATTSRESTSLESSFPLRFGLELGAAWQFYGRTAPGDPGLRAGLLLTGDAWSVAVLGHYGWPVSAQLGPAAFDLQRYAVLAEFGVSVFESAAGRFGPLARAGLTWLRRDDARSDADDAALALAQDARYRSPFFGAGAMAETQLSGALSLALRGVLNVETAIPTFTLVDASGAPVSSDSPWNVQPSLEFGARWRW